MKKALKYLGMTAAAFAGLAVLCVAGLYAWSSAEISKVIPLPTHEFTAPSDSQSIARGEHFVRAIGKCGDCHGQDFGGAVGIDDPAIGYVWVPNLTSGRGGIPSATSAATWERAIRHGLGPDGRRLVMMPSNEFQFISDEDLGTVIAYLKSVPPVDRDRLPRKLGPVARALYAAGEFPLFPNAYVTHAEEVVPSVAADTTARYGKYLADIGCSGCHGVTYGGGKIPGTPPDWPPPANLTPTGIGHYTYEGFRNALLTGNRPDGSAINPFMPFNATKLMTEVEMQAVWNYLRTLPPREFGTR